MKNLPQKLQNHKSFSKIFQKGKFTFGLIAPFKGYPSYSPDMQDFTALAKMADKGGVSALWVRDVPFYDPNFGDVGQIYDPFATLGYLSALTENIALGSAGIVTPLREPILTAKSATSIDHLSGGRFLLGMSSGDRMSEYPAFNENYHTRAERFRENWEIIQRLISEDFPKFETENYGDFRGNLDLIPKPKNTLPMIAIGRARQEIEWLANVPDAWIWHGVNPNDTAKIIQELDNLNEDRFWRPFGYANFLEITENQNEPSQLFNNIYLRGGVKSLADFWAEQKEKGLSHIALNLKPTKRPAQEVLQEFIEEIVSKF